MTKAKMAEIILTALAVAALWYVAMCAYLYFNQKSLIYFPDSSSFEQCPNFADAEKVVHKGTRMYYKHNGSTLAVFYHGNAGTACENRRLKEFLEQRNYSYLFVEYAGYANDKREPSYSLIVEDVKNAAEYASTLKMKKVVVIGESIGSGAASYHASLANPEAAILVVPFNSFAELGREKYPLFPVAWLLTERYDNALWLKNYKGRVLIVHGDADNIVPQHHSKKLFDSLTTADKAYASIKGAGHNDVYDFNETWDAIGKALA
jgi:fermentation-respiration switch protein FrsA (DUF1100 family)